MSALTHKNTRKDALRWNDSELASAVQTAHSWAEVARILGYSPTGSASRKIMQERATELGIDSSHFVAQPGRPSKLPPADRLAGHFHPPWGDDELRMAVALATSWRGVSRSLGISSKGGRQLRVLKDRIKALGLDVSHFKGTRRWSPAQLSQALEGAGDWDAVTQALGVADNRQNRTTILRHAERLDIPTAHMLDEPKPATLGQSHLGHLRAAAPTLAAAWFILRGYIPSMPLEAKPYDLLVDTGGSVQRVQIKTCMASKGDVTIAYRLSGTTKGALVPYDASDVEQFFILDGDLNIYLIPIAIVTGKLRISLKKYQRFRVGSARSLIE
ncbi:group I intron-associated PD-(D/E)XK endonuclease [Nonomuraea guangzhouensis]|uniref:Group I intron-associated PD-(D/E)XK endonuclease n=1 Tax=Nonomuraea guangzhouensis TaxID=1291555 RepID=A0ABW4GK24_9ACTN|nr:group I intron-associated PD-(D/E)XK endonuclease [Nonomuraea guangzhouensis]